MLMNVSALVSLATIENMTAHQGNRAVGDEVVLGVRCRRPTHMPSSVMPTRYATMTRKSRAFSPRIADRDQCYFDDDSASIAKYSASPRPIAAGAAVPLFRASTRCQNSRSS